MSYQVLARKYRPRGFDELVGQEHVVRALTNALASARLHHAYLFTGTRGVGKTTVARVFAKCLNCESGITAAPCGTCSTCQELDEGRFVDLIEVDAASRAKVDETRDLMDNVQFAPARGRFKVYLIDEVHMFSAHSFNALLKTLEEPPPHVKFLLATTDPQKLPITVLSRCLQFHMRQLLPDEISRYLEHLSVAEGFTADAGGLDLVARAAAGSMRDGLSLLDQAIAHGDGFVREADVRAMLGVTRRDAVYDVLDAIAANAPARMLDLIDELASEAPDFEALLGEILSALQRVAVVQAVPDRDIDEAANAARVRALADAFAPEDVQLLYQIGILGRRDMPYALDPRSGLEMTLLRMLAFKPSDAPEGGGPKTIVTPAARPTANVAAAGKPANATSSSAPPGAISASAAATSASEPRSAVASAPVPPPAVVPARVPAATAALVRPSARELVAPKQHDNGPIDFDAAMDAFHADESQMDDDGAADVLPPAAATSMAPSDARATPAAPAAAVSRVAVSRVAVERARPPAVSDVPVVDSLNGHDQVSESGGAGAASPVIINGASTDKATNGEFSISCASGPPLSPDNWTAVAASMNIGGLAGALAANCELVSFDGATAQIRLAPNHAGLNSTRAVNEVQKALGTYAGVEVKLEVVMGELQRESLAQSKEQQAAALQASATAAIREDPTVQAICDMFDATVDEQEIRPRGDA